ncbi:plasminogen receptor (KT) [Vanessa tameamea]|uniref:Plasminogen receptor (KT) n=1 Tax=Vanessa tameamea TaxID=334116 RepID=A0A8B8HEP9_VANTA|nr:plasminogen receptor (KT) [Vanessa tameamea]XP_047540242.1 plasminogen receptor (KT) [Vanessa atalanta]
MGNYISINLEDHYRRNEKFLQNLNEIAMERQIQLKNQMAERQRAMDLAKSRDLCLWYSVFYVSATAGLFTGFRRTKRAYFLFPLLPLTFVNLYYWDLAYGNKMHRLRMEAEHIMAHESDLLEVPCGLPTPSSIDQRRLDQEERSKIHPPLP